LQAITNLGCVLIVALVQKEQHQKNCRRYHDGDDDVFKKQSGGKNAVAAVGTSSRRMLYSVSAVRTKLLSPISHGIAQLQ
jgi:hypothetical protein